MLSQVDILILIKKSNKENPKLEAGDRVRISKCKDIFEKVYTPNWSEENFMIKKLMSWIYMLLVIFTVKKLLECFTKKNCKKQIKNSLDLDK